MRTPQATTRRLPTAPIVTLLLVLLVAAAGVGTWYAVRKAPSANTTFPSTCCNAGTVGSSYVQNFFTSGRVGPFNWTVSAGQLPPSVTLTSGHLDGTPTAAGTFTFTIKITDSAGNQANEPGSITISP